MQKLYLALTLIGFIAPNYLVLLESLENGNILLYGDPIRTFEQMFANRISTIFGIDLLFGVAVFFIWSYRDSRENGLQKVGLVWLFTMLFGLASGFPLYLYLRESLRGDSAD